MKRRAMLAVILGAAVLTAGCSQSSEQKTTETAAQTSAATETTAQTEAATEEEVLVVEDTTEAVAEGAEETALEVTEAETEALLLEAETEAVVVEEATEAATDAATEAAEESTEGVTEDIEDVTEAEEEELGERPEYTALDSVTLGEYKGLDVAVDGYTVTDQEVEDGVISALKAASLYDTFEEGTVEEGDIANIDYTGKKDGEAFDGGTAEGYDLEIGSGTFIDGFEEGLVGVKVGDTVDLNLTFPENYQSEELAGQDVVFTVKVNSVKRVQEATDENIATASNDEYTTVDGYREYVRQQITDSYEQNQKSQINSALMEQLYDVCTIDEYPADLVEYSTKQMEQTYTQYAQAYGMEYLDLMYQITGASTEEAVAEMVDNAVKQSLQQEMILKAISEQENLELSDEEFTEGCEKYAADYGYESAEAFLADVDESIVRTELTLTKALDFVRENANVTINEPAAEEAVTEAVTE